MANIKEMKVTGRVVRQVNPEELPVGIVVCDEVKVLRFDASEVQTLEVVGKPHDPSQRLPSQVKGVIVEGVVVEIKPETGT